MEVVRLPRERVGEASALLARAFQDDPAWGWVFPNARRRAALLPWLFELGFEIADADVWTTAGELLGVARWLPPGRPNVHVGAMLRALVATPLRAREATSRFFAYGRAVDAMRAAAVPEPHWYLAGIGVEPSHQRRGIGASLLAPGLEAAAEAGLPCALLTNSERNLSFYRRHGFEVVREGHTPDGGPRAWMMRLS
ncbi:MAG TPA: GNAT family N-acetyltransferase [Gaiellaceae bacterium]|nr:GNAT family N-acetyltransferase [Gaiellaceae bacterium]